MMDSMLRLAADVRPGGACLGVSDGKIIEQPWEHLFRAELRRNYVTSRRTGAEWAARGLVDVYFCVRR